MAPKHCAIAKNTAIALARTSIGKISLTVRYAALAPAEAKKKMTHHATRLRDRVEHARVEQHGA